MSLNCRAGDLAIVTRSDFPERCGSIVEVIRPYPNKRYGDWVIRWRGVDYAAYDSCLKPIRDQDGNESFLKGVSIDAQIEVLRKINRRNKERA